MDFLVGLLQWAWEFCLYILLPGYLMLLAARWMSHDTAQKAKIKDLQETVARLEG